MAKLTKEIENLFKEQTGLTKKQKFCVYLATATRDGIPNVVPIGGSRLRGEETIVIPVNFLNKTKNNIEENPRVAIVVSDEEKHDGYQFKGKIKIEYSGTIFEETEKFMRDFSKAADIDPPILPKGAAVFTIEEVYSVKPGKDAGNRLI